MSSKSTTLVIASLVVIAAVAFFSYRSSNTPNGEEVTGAIGTVDKYRSEQMSDSDVVLEGFDPADSDRVIEAWLSDNATIEELADLLGKSTSQYERSMYLRYASAATQSDMLGKTSVADQAKFFERTTDTERVVSWGRVAHERQVAELAKQNVKLEDFNRMNDLQKSQVIAASSLEMKSQMLGKMTVGERHGLIGRLSESERSTVLGRASHTQSVEILGRSDFEAKASMFERSSYQKQSNILARSSNVTKAAVYERTSEQGKMALLRYATTEEMGRVFGRMDDAGKITLLGKANATELNRMFGRLSETERTAALEQARVSSADFERMNEQGKMAALGRVSVDTKVAMLRTASVSEKQSILARVHEAEFGRVNQAEYGRTDETGLGRTDQTQLSRTQQTEFGKMFFGKTTVNERAAWIDRAPENERAFVAKSAVTTQRTFQAERMQHQLGRQIGTERTNSQQLERQSEMGKTSSQQNN